MRFFNFLRSPPDPPRASDAAFASLLVAHAWEAAEQCIERFLRRDNCESETDVLLMYENLLTIYLALVFAHLEHHKMPACERLIRQETENRFDVAASAKLAALFANVYRVRDYLHPPSRTHSFEELKVGWPLLIRSLLDDYHRDHFRPSSFLELVDAKSTAEFLVEHVKRVEAHCRLRSECRSAS